MKSALARNWLEVARNKEKVDNILLEDASGYVIRSRFKISFANEVAYLKKMKINGSPFVPNYSGLHSYLAGLGSLPDVARDELEKDMLMEKKGDIVKESENYKSPGLDGLSYEFYKNTFDLIQDELLKVFQCQLNRKNIVDSNTEGVTRLAPKVDGIPSVDELRQITLLNCDYKLLSKWFVRRVKHHIIQSGQLCAVGKKNILFRVSNILSSIL